MIGSVLSFVAHLITNLIQSTGYFGLFFLMMIESAGIPAPSEIIMPFSGYLVFQGQFNLFIVALVGALANLAGSLIAYAIGYVGGRPLIEKFGRYILFSKHDLDLTEKYFNKYGTLTVFLSRLLPVVRTYISFPAGMARMPLLKFSIYTFIGAFGWSYALAYVGVKLGENWDILRIYFHKFDVLIGIILVVGLYLWIRRHLHHKKSQ